MDFSLVSKVFKTKKTKQSIKNTAISIKYDHIHCQINKHSSSDVKYTISSYKLRRNAVYFDCPLNSFAPFMQFQLDCRQNYTVTSIENYIYKKPKWQSMTITNVYYLLEQVMKYCTKLRIVTQKNNGDIKSRCTVRQKFEAHNVSTPLWWAT